MRPGIVYLTERSPNINPDPKQIELEPIACFYCHKSFRLFTPKDWKEEEGVTDLGWDVQIKELRERAKRAIGLDCPNVRQEGQPMRPPHPSPVRLYESGMVGV